MTLPPLHTWPDFDDDGYPNNATIIGAYADSVAVVLDGPHHDAFLHMALAAPDLLAALEDLLKEAQINMRGGKGHLLDSARAAITKAKAKGE